jgi:hypothetical protein
MRSDFGLSPTNAIAVVPGERFGRYTVLDTGQRQGTYIYMAICQCDCGSAPKAVRFDSLTSGVSQSCGCLQKERSTKHGMYKSVHYQRWLGMMDRCYNRKCNAYKDYGGRGIKVYEPWHDIRNFVADLPDGYFSGAEIDRIDNDGDYAPGNVRWSTPSENSRNRRSTHLLEYDGETRPLSEWSENTGIPLGTLWERLEVWGWAPENALTTPPLDANERMAIARAARWGGHVKAPAKERVRQKRFVEYEGETLTLAQLSERTGIGQKFLAKRIFERNWTVEKATRGCK